MRERKNVSCAFVCYGQISCIPNYQKSPEIIFITHYHALRRIHGRMSSIGKSWLGNEISVPCNFIMGTDTWRCTIFRGPWGK